MFKEYSWCSSPHWQVPVDFRKIPFYLLDFVQSGTICRRSIYGGIMSFGCSLVVWLRSQTYIPSLWPCPSRNLKAATLHCTQHCHCSGLCRDMKRIGSSTSSGTGSIPVHRHSGVRLFSSFCSVEPSICIFHHSIDHDFTNVFIYIALVTLSYPYPYFPSRHLCLPPARSVQRQAE